MRILMLIRSFRCNICNAFDHWNCADTPDHIPLQTRTVTNSHHHLQRWLPDIYPDSLYKTHWRNNTIMVVLVQTLRWPAPLNLDSIPTGADVWLDERYYGTTPQIIGGLSAGSLPWRLRRQVYYDYMEPFTIVAGQTSSHSPRMTAYIAVIRLWRSPDTDKPCGRSGLCE